VPIKVFLVEDMPSVHAAVADLLHAIGDFSLAGCAATEAEANLWLDEHASGWDLAIIDLVLEQGSGMGVINKCRRTSPHANVMVFSSYVTPGIYKHCLRLGADVAIGKADTPAFIEYCSGLSASA
jgi:DNA-binding NarL/FixJ family response regulator